MDDINLHALICYLFLKELSKGVHKNMCATLGESAPPYSMVKKWDAAEPKQAERGDCMKADTVHFLRHC